jgi:hypothetical protein
VQDIASRETSDIPMTVRPLLALASLLYAVSGPAVGAEIPAESCDQLRARIGVLAPGDADLLRRLAMRSKECAFSSAEFYKAAYGDRPLPPPEARDYRRRHDDDDD